MMIEVIDLRAVDDSLRIDVEPSIGCMLEPPRPETGVSIKPPLSKGERAALIEAEEPESEIVRWLTAPIKKVGELLELRLAGTAPREEHVTTAIELAEKIMVLRGLRVAKVVSHVDNIRSERLVLDDSQPGVDEPRNATRRA